MKRCPTCQRTYPDNAPDACPYDGTPVVSDAPQQQYYQGGQQPPYGAPQGDPSQWQQQPQPGGYYQQPGGAYPPPYGNQYAPTGGSSALSNATFYSGLGAFILLVIFIVIVAMARSGAIDLGTLISLAPILQISSWVMLLAGAASIILGIVALVSAGKNPGISKAKAIIGMCLGVIPLLLFILGIAARSSGMG